MTKDKRACDCISLILFRNDSARPPQTWATSLTRWFQECEARMRPYLPCHRDVAETVALYTSNLQHFCQTQMGHIPERKSFSCWCLFELFSVISLKWISVSIRSYFEMKIQKLLHADPTTTANWATVCITYLWKDSFSVNSEKRGFPTTPVSYNNNLEFVLQAGVSSVCSWSFLGHVLWKDRWGWIFPVTAGPGSVYILWR